MVQLKKSIVEVRAVENSLEHALVIATAMLNNDLNYKAYSQGRKIRSVLHQLHETAVIDLKNDAGIPELTRFQEYFHEYEIVVYSGLNCKSIVYQGNVESHKRINLLFVEIPRNYYVISNLTGAKAKRYVCEGWNKGCSYGVEHTWEPTCNDCMVSPPV